MLTPGKKTIDPQSAGNTEHLHQSPQKINSFHQHPTKGRQLKIIKKNCNGKTSFLNAYSRISDKEKENSETLGHCKIHVDG